MQHHPVVHKPRTPDSLIIRTALILGFSGIYFLTAKLGLSMTSEAAQVSVIWPASGLAMAMILLLGYYLWPAVFLGAFLANVTASEPLITALGVAAGNTLEALACVWVLHHYFAFDPALKRLKDVLGLLSAALITTMIAATIGTLSLCLSEVQPWEHFTLLWFLWWLGDATGILIFAPMLLVWSRPVMRWQTANMVEGALLVAALGMALVASFYTHPGQEVVYMYPYSFFPFSIWASLRFGQRGATFVTLLCSIAAITATLLEWGPFSAMPYSIGLIQLQIFIAVLTITGLCLSAVITERRWAEETRSFLASVVAYSEDAIIGNNLGEIINFWNGGAERLYGYSAAEAVGQSVNMVIPPGRREEERHIMDRLYRGERVEHYETVRVAKGGALINISLSVSPIYNGKGELVGVSKVARDITERIEGERALKEADRRKDEFLATLAHELRNPLAPLSNALNIIRQPTMDVSRREEALDIMHRQVHQLIRLVDDLLDVSRISHGKVELRKEHIRLSDAIHSALETTRPLIEASGHQLTVTMPEETLWLDGDLTRLSQIFSNLLNNAAKYTPTGGHILLEAARENNQVAVRVRDTGIGIDPDMLPRVFDIFTQADNSLQKTHGGLGIGLTLVKSLVEMHGGTVRVQSGGYNQGSEFTVRLPLAQAPAERTDVTKSTPRESSDSHIAKGTRPLRVLVVDDSPNLAKTLAWMVELLGYEVRTAHNGVGALEVAQAFIPDVVLLDIGMSDINGYEVCRRMRADPRLKHAVIVAQTGWGQAEHRQRSKEAGFDHHLVKPVELDVLEKLLASLTPPSAAA